MAGRTQITRQASTGGLGTRSLRAQVTARAVLSIRHFGTALKWDMVTERHANQKISGLDSVEAGSRSGEIEGIYFGEIGHQMKEPNFNN